MYASGTTTEKYIHHRVHDIVTSFQVRIIFLSLYMILCMFFVFYNRVVFFVPFLMHCSRLISNNKDLFTHVPVLTFTGVHWALPLAGDFGSASIGR